MPRFWAVFLYPVLIPYAHGLRDPLRESPAVHPHSTATQPGQQKYPAPPSPQFAARMSSRSAHPCHVLVLPPPHGFRGRYEILEM